MLKKVMDFFMLILKKETKLLTNFSFSFSLLFWFHKYYLHKLVMFFFFFSNFYALISLFFIWIWVNTTQNWSRSNGNDGLFCLVHSFKIGIFPLFNIKQDELWYVPSFVLLTYIFFKKISLCAMKYFLWGTNFA